MNRRKIDPDAFEGWKAHPITEALIGLLNSEVTRLERVWMAQSLEAGSCDPMVLAKIRERRQAYQEIVSLTAEKLEDMINE